MKKVFVIALLLMFGFCSYVEARVQYDTSGRKIVDDNTIRGRRKAQEMQVQTQKRMQAAAAAKIDYEQALKSIEKPLFESNYYQDRK